MKFLSLAIFFLSVAASAGPKKEFTVDDFIGTWEGTYRTVGIKSVSSQASLGVVKDNDKKEVVGDQVIGISSNPEKVLFTKVDQKLSSCTFDGQQKHCTYWIFFSDTVIRGYRFDESHSSHLKYVGRFFLKKKPA
ncbi:MAG: hypothetical protein HY390_06705 [Deltaproteobacteria bacterium]|nr:hypothetical protein [Deltaproteobacteria bacterium]